MKRRSRLDVLGFSKHESYDSIINRLIDRWQARQPEMEKLDDFYSRFTETMRELTLKMLAESSATARQHVKEILSQSPSPKDISKIINEHVKSKEILNERVSHKGVKKQ